MSKDEILSDLLSYMLGRDIEAFHKPSRKVYLENGYLPKQLIKHPAYKVFFERVKDELIEGLKHGTQTIEILLKPSDFPEVTNIRGLSEWIMSLSFEDEWEEFGEECWTSINVITKLIPENENTLIAITNDAAKVMLGESARPPLPDVIH